MVALGDAVLKRRSHSTLVIRFHAFIVQMKNISVHKAIMNQDPCLVAL